jgi:hypothetical protein
LRSNYAFDLLVRQHHLLDWGWGGLGWRHLVHRRLLGLRQRGAIGQDGYRGGETDDAQGTREWTNERTH